MSNLEALRHLDEIKFALEWEDFRLIAPHIIQWSERSGGTIIVSAVLIKSTELEKITSIKVWQVFDILVGLVT